MKRHDNIINEENTEGSENEPVVKLQRRLGLWGAVAMVVGIIIGSGIFISPTGVTRGSGSVALSLILWLAGGLASLCGALSFVELGLMLPLSGGQYVYILRYIGRPVAFLFAWSTGILIHPASVAIVSLTCAKYILTPFYSVDCSQPPESHIAMLALVIIGYLAAQNMYSVAISTKIQMTFTIAKLLALFAIIIGGLYTLGRGKTENISKGFEDTNSNVGEIMSGFLGALFAYGGWEHIVAFTEEVIDPKKNLVRGLYVAVGLVTLVYALANVSYLSVLSVPQLLDSSVVVIAWVENVIPTLSWLMAVSVAMSTFGGVNGTFFISSRMYLAYAREGHTLKAMAMINVNMYTPSAAILFEALLSTVMVFLGDVQQLIGFTVVLAWTFNGLTMALVPYLRWRHPHLHRPYKAPLVMSVLGIVFAVLTVVIPVALDPQIEYILAIALCLAGFIFYIPFVHFKWKLPGMDHFTTFIQLVMNITLTDYKQMD